MNPPQTPLSSIPVRTPFLLSVAENVIPLLSLMIRLILYICINGTIYMYKKSKIKMYRCYTVTMEVNSMILKSSIIVDLKINSLEDLYKLKPFTENSSLNINKSQIARELGVDRRTVDKYINGFQKSKKRKKGSRLDKYYDVIQELLSEQNSQVFYYKRILWQYLVDNHGLNNCKYSNFCHYINSHEEFAAYFKEKKPSNADRPVIRFETPEGKQAQLDWKENIPFVLKSGETITINVLVLLLSYSRFRVYRLSLSRTQDVLLALLNDAFETFGGVPQEIVTDNMKTVMDQSRTDASKGKVNVRFEQFAKDYGFQIRPCIAGRPQTKAKVEAPMKILDEIRAYSGRLDYTELCELIERINNRINSQVNQGTGRIPLLYFEKEKAFLNPLPTEEIRKHYRIDTYRSRVNPSSMVTYKNSQYSVPPEYIGREMKLQVYDNYIHIYYNTTLVTLHSLSSKKLNYHEKHYIAIAQQSHSFQKEDIESRAKENLSVIGDVYRYE